MSVQQHDWLKCFTVWFWTGWEWTLDLLRWHVSMLSSSLTEQPAVRQKRFPGCVKSRQRSHEERRWCNVFGWSEQMSGRSHTATVCLSVCLRLKRSKRCLVNLLLFLSAALILKGNLSAPVGALLCLHCFTFSPVGEVEFKCIQPQK